MRNNELISIVIPVYNVENFLERCITSVLNQTFENIEIILVNDGSTDNSLRICQQYEKIDSRILVINQENQGLSAARNSGINQARGKYICFIDSDDWIHDKYLEILYNDIEKNNAQISIIDKQIVYEGQENYKYDIPDKSEFEVYNKYEAIETMLQGNWIASWDKMYDRSLFQNIRFPVGRNNEDYAILIYLFEKCEKVVYRKIKLYYYFQRKGSITKSKLNNRSFDEIINGEEIYRYTEKNYPQFAKYAEYNWIASLLKLSCQTVSSKQYSDKFEEIFHVLYKNRKTFKSNECLLKQQKMFLVFVCGGKRVYKTYLKVYNKYKGE